MQVFVVRINDVRTMLCVAPSPEDPPALPDGKQPWCRDRDLVMPEWVKTLAKDRYFFIGSALVVPNPDGSKSFFLKIVYIVQSPTLYMAVAPLQLVPVVRRQLPVGASALQANQAFITHAFKCNYAVFQTAADLPPVEIGQLEMIRHLRHDGGTLLTTSWDSEPIHVLVRGTAREPRGSGQENKPSSTSPKELREHEELLQQMPWLANLDKMENFARELRKELHCDTQAAAAADAVVHEIDEEAMLSAISLLEAERENEVAIAAAVGTVDFWTKHLGGESNVLKGKDFYDAVQGQASDAGQEWARSHGMQISFKSTFTEHGSEPSKVLVRSWCHRMQFF